MTTKTAATGLTKREAGHLATIKECFAEMARIRKRMKASDERIARADEAIRRSQTEIRTLLSHARSHR